MTRRVIVYRRENIYYISQEFNGDHDEAELFDLMYLPTTATWDNVRKGFTDRTVDFANFFEGVRLAENKYGYSHERLIEADERPLGTYDEIWEFTKNGLELVKEEI